MRIAQTCLKPLDKIRVSVYNQCIKNIAQIFRNYIIGRMCKIMEVLVVLITLAVITVVGILVFLAGKTIFEFIIDHACLKYIVIGLFALALAGMVGPEILLLVGVILLFKLVIHGIGYIAYKTSKIFPDDPGFSILDPPKHTEEDYEIIDFDAYEDMFGNKYIYDREYGELIDKNHQRIKVSQVHGSDSELEDSKGNWYGSTIIFKS